MKFVYSFNLIDVKTGLYVCYGSGVRLEKEAFENAIKMLRKVEGCRNDSQQRKTGQIL